MAKNVAISLILLLLQLFYTSIIIVEWFEDLKITNKASKAFGEFDSTTILLNVTKVTNSSADIS